MASSQHHANRRWLETMSDAYPWGAVTDTGMAIDFDLDAISRTTDYRVRSWRFKTKADRDRFVNAVPTAETAGGPE
jgi:hypothetical protein